MQSKVEKILIPQQQVLVCSNTDARLEKYDRLIIATGARPLIPNIINVNNFDNVYTVRKIEDGIAIREKMLQSKRVVIVGSGFIGLELLEAFVKNGLEVSVIEKSNRIMAAFDTDIQN